MSIFSWFARKPQPTMPLVSSSLSRHEETRPLARAGTASAVVKIPDQKKNARYMRRELLYAIVRESMIRFGVLSGGYKFKALALDPRGLRFMVMVDLATEFGGQAERQSEIEALIAQSAKARHGIVVTAVYWRLNEYVAVGKPPSEMGAAGSTQDGNKTPQGQAGAPSQNAPIRMVSGVAAAAAAAGLSAKSQWQSPRDASSSQPMPLFPMDGSFVADDGEHVGLTPLTHFEPIAHDEVEAFKRALTAGASTELPIAQGANTKSNQPQANNASYTLLTGFEDTEAVDPDFVAPALGTTQYGELR